MGGDDLHPNGPGLPREAETGAHQCGEQRMAVQPQEVKTGRELLAEGERARAEEPIGHEVSGLRHSETQPNQRPVDDPVANRVELAPQEQHDEQEREKLEAFLEQRRGNGMAKTKLQHFIRADLRERQRRLAERIERARVRRCQAKRLQKPCAGGTGEKQREPDANEHAEQEDTEEDEGGLAFAAVQPPNKA